MAVAFLQKRWSQKPPVGAQINWGHPLARRLIALFVMNEGGGSPMSLVSSQRMIPTGAPLWATNRAGLARNYAAISAWDKTAEPLPSINNGVTIVMIRRKTDT